MASRAATCVLQRAAVPAGSGWAGGQTRSLCKLGVAPRLFSGRDRSSFRQRVGTAFDAMPCAWLPTLPTVSRAQGAQLLLPASARAAFLMRRLSSSSPSSMARAPTVCEPSDISTISEGEAGTSTYRLRFFASAENDGRRAVGRREISPWHDIPLLAAEEGYHNAVIEIPKMTTPKMEVPTKEAHNPIAQDLKKGELRNYHGPIYWNYGMFPRTWENPSVLEEHDGYGACAGDNDPLDLVEIGSEALPCGSVVSVRVLGALAMIDEGEVDWKIITLRRGDKLADVLHDIADVEAHCPGVVSGIREWMRWYKTPDGKPLNGFGFAEAALDRRQALDVVAQTHEEWKRLYDGRTSKGKLWVPDQ